MKVEQIVGLASEVARDVVLEWAAVKYVQVWAGPEFAAFAA